MGPDLTGYVLTFDDEFDSLSISQNGVGTTYADIRPQWRSENGDYDIGFGDSAFVDPATGVNPFSLQNGALQITATQISSELNTNSPIVGNAEWASGLITTQDSFSQEYGYFEMRAELPTAVGVWPAFWMLPVNPPASGPPPELDVMETYGGSDDVNSTVHTNETGSPTSQAIQTDEPSIESGFHTYGVLWTPTSLTFYFDGQETGQITTPADMNQAMYILADLAMQDVPGATTTPQSMDIDYIRVFSDASNAVAVPLETVSSPDGDDTADLYGATAANATCYCPGTLIRTKYGDKRVEELQIGYEVMTASGAARPIKWIGQRSYSGRFALGQKNLLPICIKASAIDENVPERDLWISPHHAMYLEGILIEAKDLVNGVSIIQAEQVEKIDYFHIELEKHDVIIAEGAQSESYVDDDNRGLFHNAHEYRTIYPDAQKIPTRYCAPRRDAGYGVEAARQRIEARAGLRPKINDYQLTLRGFVDVANSRLIAGWAQNVEHPEAPVCLDIYVGQTLIGQTLANRYREDLERAGFGSGHHSFEFRPTAGLALIFPLVEVRRSLDGTVLAGPHNQASRLQISA